MNFSLFRKLTAAAACLLLVPASALFMPSEGDGSLPAISVSPDDPFAAVEALEDSLGIENARESLVLQRAAPVAYGTVYRFRRVGEEGEALTLSVDGTGKLLSVNYTPDPVTVTQKPSSLSVGSLQTDGLGEEVDVPINEENGQYSLSDELRNIYTYDMNNGTTLIWRTLVTSASGVFDDPLAVSAYKSVLDAYDYYADARNTGVSRLGMDGKNDDVWGNTADAGELSVYVLVHYDRNFENAFFEYLPSRHAALLCIGDGSMSGDIYRQARATDVLAHEYQHGITQFIAGLDYLNEAGAINEAMSDIFGALIEGNDPHDEAFWTTGENAVPAGQDYLRSAILPGSTTRFNAKNMYPLCHRVHSHDTCDNGGVHYNSSVLTHFQYNLWRSMPEFFTRERIGTLWYTTLNALTSDAGFAEFAREFRLAAEHLGYPEGVLALIDECFYASGITAGDDYHLVTFRGASGELLDEVCVKDGGSPLLPAEPVRESTSQYDYRFTGWSADLSSVTSDMTVTARYENVLRKYTVRFTDGDGNLLKEETVSYGGAATPPSDPAKPAEGRTGYLFDGWLGGNYERVQTDLVLFPSFREVECYLVTFLDAEDLPIETVSILPGEAATPPGAPQKASTAQYDFIFTGWEGEFGAVTQDLTVRPLYEARLRQYTVTLESRGEQLEQTEYGYGEQPALSAPEGEGFAGWYFDEAFTRPAEGFTVTGDVTLYARWEEGCSASSLFTVPFLFALLPLCLKRKKQ